MDPARVNKRGRPDATGSRAATVGIYKAASDWNGLVSDFFFEVRRHCGERCFAIDQGRNRLSGFWKIRERRPEQGVADAAANDQDKPGDRDPENDSGRRELSESPDAGADLSENGSRKSQVGHLANMTHRQRLAYPASPPGGVLLGDFPHHARMSAPIEGRSSVEQSGDGANRSLQGKPRRLCDNR